MATVRIVFFARLKEILEVSELNLEIDSEVKRVTDLMKLLVRRGPIWERQFNPRNKALMVAINQTMASFSHEIEDGDEIAFFPPMTGG